MNSPNLAETLDILIHAEQRSLLPRLMESTVFVSWVSADEAEAVRGMIKEERQHVSWLVDAMNELGESPTPWTADIHSASFHYVELNYALPIVLSSKKGILQAYEWAAGATAADSRSAALVSRITTRHQAHLQTLQSFISQLHNSTATPVPNV